MTPAPDPSAATTYLDRLAARTAAVGTVLCLGIDPDPDALPPAFSRDVAGVERFALLLARVAARHAAAVKPNLAFFEAFGSAGLAALERVRARIPADLPVVADAKRGDIGSTAARQAVALFDVLGADAVTVSPYLGEEAIAPLLSRATGWRTCSAGRRTRARRSSSRSSSRLARRTTAPRRAAVPPRGPTRGHVGSGGTVGLVVGATAPTELAAIRDVAPGLPFLVPGVGAQGARSSRSLPLDPPEPPRRVVGRAAASSST